MCADGRSEEPVLASPSIEYLPESTVLWLFPWDHEKFKPSNERLKKLSSVPISHKRKPSVGPLSRLQDPKNQSRAN